MLMHHIWFTDCRKDSLAPEGSLVSPLGCLTGETHSETGHQEWGQERLLSVRWSGQGDHIQSTTPLSELVTVRKLGQPLVGPITV